LLLCSDGLAAYPGWSRRAAIYLLLGASAVLFSRYDIFPALATFLAVDAARRDRWGRAWGWAVVGGLLKLFPLVLLPGFLLAERARTGHWPLRRCGAACVPFALVAALQSALSSGSVLSPLLYEARRGFDLESVAADLTLLADPLHVKWVISYGSWEIVGAYHGLISVLVTVAMVAGLIAIWRLAAQGRLSIEACSLAVLSVAVLGDKAFSPQYIIWLVPLWAYWPLRRGWVAAAALTTVVFPFLILFETVNTPYAFYPAAAVSVVRNLVLIVATVRWLQGQVRAREIVVSPQPEHRRPALDRVRASVGAGRYACEAEGTADRSARRSSAPTIGPTLHLLQEPGSREQTPNPAADPSPNELEARPT
jgi:hypothetical protein